jgi:hypothetical protein
MKRILTITACAFALPGIALAATRTYETGAFEGVSVAAGIEADINVGPARSVTAETRADNFDDLRISVEGNVLRIERPPRSWFTNWFAGNRTDYKVRVTTPTLHSLSVASGADASVRGNPEGDFTVAASSGSEATVTQLKGRYVNASTSSGSDLKISGTCLSIAANGSDLDAEGLVCEDVTVNASSGSDVSVAATKHVAGGASSGSDVRVRGRPSVVQVKTSSGADISVRE